MWSESPPQTPPIRRSRSQSRTSSSGKPRTEEVQPLRQPVPSFDTVDETPKMKTRLLSAMFKWSETSGYRWLRITLCLLLIVFVPKGYLEINNLIQQVGEGNAAVKEQRPLTITLDFDKAIQKGHYSIKSYEEMQICFYIEPPKHLFPDMSPDKKSLSPNETESSLNQTIKTPRPLDSNNASRKTEEIGKTSMEQS